MYETGRVEHFMKIVNFQISDLFLVGEKSVDFKA